MLKQKRRYIWVGKILAKILKTSVYGFLSPRDPSFSYFIMSYVMGKIRKKTWWSRDPEAVAQRHSVKKVFLKIWQNSLENTCPRVSFLIKLKDESCNFIKKETLAQVFFCEFFELLETCVVTESLRWLLPEILHCREMERRTKPYL